MNAALKATIATIPVRTIRAVFGSVTVGATAVLLLVVGLLHPSLGVVVGYAFVPLALAAASWAILVAVRLYVVGALPGDVNDDDVIPRTLQPWIRCWLLARFGLLGSGLLLILIGAGVAIVQRHWVGVVIQAFVYLMWGRMLSDAVFGAIFNAGVISGRRQRPVSRDSCRVKPSDDAR